MCKRQARLIGGLYQWALHGESEQQRQQGASFDRFALVRNGLEVNHDAIIS
jgi:hypothetical protein